MTEPTSKFMTALAQFKSKVAVRIVFVPYTRIASHFEVSIVVLIMMIVYHSRPTQHRAQRLRKL
jgi:hypothetical protein